jgi:hypothetical protein
MVSKFVLSFGFGSEWQRLLGECCSLAPFPWYILESFSPPVALLSVGFRSLKIRVVAHAVSWLGCLELFSW